MAPELMKKVTGTPSATGTCATDGPAFAGGATDGPPREGRATPPRDGRATVVGMAARLARGSVMNSICGTRHQQLRGGGQVTMRRSSSTEGASGGDPIAKIIAEVIETEKAYVDDLDTMLAAADAMFGHHDYRELFEGDMGMMDDGQHENALLKEAEEAHHHAHEAADDAMKAVFSGAPEGSLADGAMAIGFAEGGMGFDAMSLTDENAEGGKVDQLQMEDAIEAFIQKVDENTIAAFAYMGASPKGPRSLLESCMDLSASVCVRAQERV